MVRTITVIIMLIIGFSVFNLGIDRLQWGSPEGLHPLVAFPLTILIVGIACLIEYNRNEYKEIRRINRRFEKE